MSNTERKKPALTTFFGGKNRQQARVVHDALDPMAIRKKYVKNADGSVTRHKTRAGFPQAVTERETDEPEGEIIIRGYVARIMNSSAETLELIWRGIIKRVPITEFVLRWRKRRRQKLFGPYSVVDRWSKKQRFPDVLHFYKEKLYKNAEPMNYEHADEFSESMPVVLLKDDEYPRGVTNDAADFHLFSLSDTTVMHLSGRNKSGHPAEVYSADELDADTVAYPESHFAGVDYHRGTQRVGYTHWNVSGVGALALRARMLQLGAASPYATSVGYITQNMPATAYVFPEGPVETDTSTDWAHPVPPDSLALFEQYRREGDPATSYGVYVAEGYYDGFPVESDVETTEHVLHGVGDYTVQIPGGFFGGEQVNFDVSMTATTDYTWVDSTGGYRLANPTLIAAANQSDSPPSYQYQFRSFLESSTTVPAGTLLGGLVSSSTSTDKEWMSVSVMDCSSAITGTMFHAEVVVSGGYSSLNTMNSEPYGEFYFDGVVAGLAPPSADYYELFNAVKKLSQFVTTPTFREYSYASEETLAHSTHSLTGETRDYILFDCENDTYVYVAGTFSGAKDAPFDVLAELVVSFGGAEARKTLFHYVGGGILIPTELVYDIARYYQPIMPPRIFAPPFCKQGLFKYAAYSETPDVAPEGFTAENESGVFLLSLPLSLHRTGSEVEIPPNTLAFTPLNFYAFVGSFGGLTASAGIAALAEGVTFYCHFADGEWRDWPADVEAAAASVDHFSEVYRT